jgi:hypothetical protein
MYQYNQNITPLPYSLWPKVTRLGSILRSGEGRLVHLVADGTGRMLAAHATDNTLELFLICSAKEIQRRLARKAAKERKRTGAEVDPARLAPTVQERFRRLKPVKAGGKIKSISVRIVNKSSCRVLMALGEIVDIQAFSDGFGLGDCFSNSRPFSLFLLTTVFQIVGLFLCFYSLLFFK